jgi:hypothetical protein
VLPLHAGFEGGTNILENIKIKIENVSLCCWKFTLSSKGVTLLCNVVKKW